MWFHLESIDLIALQGDCHCVDSEARCKVGHTLSGSDQACMMKAYGLIGGLLGSLKGWESKTIECKKPWNLTSRLSTSLNLHNSIIEIKIHS